MGSPTVLPPAGAALTHSHVLAASCSRDTRVMAGQIVVQQLTNAAHWKPCLQQQLLT